MRKRNRQNRLAGPTTARAADPAAAALTARTGVAEQETPEFVTPNFSGPLDFTQSVNPVAFEGDLASEGDGLNHTVLIRDVAMFRTGDYGPKGKFSDEDLAEMVASYDPDWLEAPVTVDHVQTGPALGWVENVRAQDGILYGDFLVSRDTFDDMKTGKYKRRSIEIYRGVPYKDGTKVQYVKACSILGAATPEVKGLPQVKFHEGFAPYECFEFSEDAPPAGDDTHITKEAAMPTENNNAPGAGAPAAFAAMTEEQFNAAVDARIASVKADYENKLKEAEDRSARFADGLSAVNEKLRQSDEAKRFNDVAAKSSQEGRLSVVERDFLASIFNDLPYDAPDNANATPFMASDAPEGTAPESLTPRQKLLRYMETKAQVAPVGSPLMTTGQPQFTSAPSQPSNRTAMDPVERSKWIDKRATELHTADPTKDYGECMLTAERELIAKK